MAPVHVKNRLAITEPREVAQLLRAIHGYRGHPVVEAAFKLAPLVFVRPGELRAAYNGSRSDVRFRLRVIEEVTREHRQAQLCERLG